VRGFQRALNTFTRRYTKGIAPLRVDGKMGKLTRARIRTVKFLLGYRGKINSAANREFRERMWHPKSTRYSTPGRIALGAARRVEQRARWRKLQVQATVSPGVGRFDGRPVAKAAIPHLQWARANGWRGTLVSGWRDPNYSRSLCIRMCGAPSCPGRCAGLASNHVGNTPSRFAIDVSDYANFGRIISRSPHRPRIFNRLGARDPVHFSPSGN
jgi:hypothetical protein